MAPTICSEKDSRVRRIIRRKSSNSSVISYVGKITHRRTVNMRNASSKLASSRLSEKLSSCESDSNEDSAQLKMDLNNSKDLNQLENSRSSPVSSETSTNQDCSDRFTPALTPDSGYMTPLRNEQPFSDANLTTASGIVLALHEEDSECCMTSPLDFSEALAKTNIGRKRKNTKGLLGIAIKTIKLIKRNQLLQEKLAQLQCETRAFVESVMANPENRALRSKMQTSTISE